eukprot:13515338-Ditylum_brightwellii.AAC.1
MADGHFCGTKHNSAIVPPPQLPQILQKVPGRNLSSTLSGHLHVSVGKTATPCCTKIAHVMQQKKISSPASLLPMHTSKNFSPKTIIHLPDH